MKVNLGACGPLYAGRSLVFRLVDIIVKEKGLQKGDTFELAFDGEPLPGDRPIGSFGFKDETVLDLIASGSAV